MDDASGSSILAKIVIAIFIVVLFDLAFVNWWILKRANNIPTYTSPVENVALEPSPTASPNVSLSEISEASDVGEEPEDVADASLPANSGTTANDVVVQTPNKEIFVPLGSGQAKVASFVDLYGAEVSIDSAKYAPIDSVYLEASIWIEDGNGRAWAQLKNVTDNNPFIESQISNPTSTPTLKTSGKIPLGIGSKTYRVQAKTELEGYVTHVDNARLKIVLK